MKRVLKLMMLLMISSTAFAQSDYTRTNPTSNNSALSTFNKQSIVDANLKARLTFYTPRVATFTLNNGKDTAGAIAFNTATGRLGIYVGGGVWKSLSTTDDVSGGTVTSVAPLTLGTTGIDLNSTVATGTTTPVITLNVPTASASNRGALSSTDWTTFNNKANAFANYKTAYVDTVGNNTTGIVGRQDKPFATITAAIDALGTSGIVQIGVGRFASPDSSKIKSNFWFKGSGKPVPNWTVTLVGSVVTKSSPTKLINGTIITGRFDGSREQNITITDLGIDVGSAWCTASNGGIADEGLIFWATDFLNPHPPLPGIVVKNVSVLGQSATASVHAASFENLYYPIVDNLSTYYCAAGTVIKSTGGTYSNIQTFGHNTWGFYIKANAEIACRDIVADNISVGSIGDHDGSGIVMTVEDSTTMDRINLTNFSVNGVQGSGLTLSAQAGCALDQVLIANGSISDVITRSGGGDGRGIFSAARLKRAIITGISIRGVDSVGVLLKNMEWVNLSNITVVGAGSYAFDLSSDQYSNASNLYAYTTTPADRGIRWAGSKMHGTNIINLGTTTGVPLTNLNAATAITTDNNATNSTVYPTWVNAAGYSKAFNLSTTKLTFNPSTGILSATGFSGGVGTLGSLAVSGRSNFGGALDNASYLVQVKGNVSSIDANNQNTVFLSASPTARYLATSWLAGGGPTPLFIQNNSINSIRISTSGIPAILTLPGTVTDMVTISSDGTLGRTAIPSGGTAGTVNTVGVASANGFAGTSSGGANPALTLSTTINSPLLAGNGTAISAATTTGTGSTAVLSDSPTLTGTLNGADAIFSGNVTANSDSTLKKNIKPLVSVSTALRNIGAYSYDWKSNDAHAIGLIAQEVQKYYPELVKTDDKGILSMNYQNFTAVLLAGWKELDERITKLEQR